MTKSSIKRYSILGLVLLAVSAVTAAVLPGNKKLDSDKNFDGRFETTTGGGAQSCVPGGLECTVTEGTTSAAGGTTVHGPTSANSHTTNAL